MATVQFLCVCAVFIAVFTAALSVTNDDDQCGVSDYQPSQLETKLIRNGAVVPQGKYPWLAYLGSVSWVVGCTSTIVSRKYILTAGHCVCQQRPDGSPPLPCKLEDHTKMSVVVGSVNKLEGKKLKIRRLIPHEKYLAVLPGGGVTYDVGLIELEEELSYSKDVRRICLSAKNQEALKNKIVTTAGWGDIYGNSTFPARLREGTERVVSDAKCQKIYSDYEIGPMLCTESYNHTGTDNGDSGGPAMIQTNKRWTEVGITSFGYPPGDSQSPPGVYTRISYFCDWIAEKTNNEVYCDA